MTKLAILPMPFLFVFEFVFHQDFLEGRFEGKTKVEHDGSSIQFKNPAEFKIGAGLPILMTPLFTTASTTRPFCGQFGFSLLSINLH